MNWAERLANKCVEGLRIAWGFLHKPIPRWLITICTAIGKIIFNSLQAIGKEYLEQIQNKIIEINTKYSTASIDEKRRMMYDFTKTLIPVQGWKDDRIYNLIQNIYSDLKEGGVV